LKLTEQTGQPELREFCPLLALHSACGHPSLPPLLPHLFAEDRINPAEVSRAFRFEPVENIPIDPTRNLRLEHGKHFARVDQKGISLNESRQGC